MGGDGEKEKPLRAAAEQANPPAGPAPAPTALEAIYREHATEVVRAAYRVTGSMSDAEDVLQTVFLRLAGRMDAVELGAGAGAYLRRSAINAALDVMRGRRRQRAVDLDAEAGPEPADESADPERRHSGREAGAQVRRALARLNPKAAQVFALRYFEDLGNKEIARLLAMSQTAVAVTLHRTRSRLREELGAPLGGLS
jgi:RNA polymerase sigma-70 factor (ECF subfamily)